MTEQILLIDSVQKAFGAKLVLDGVTLNLNRKDRAAPVGENGAGKTTLARIILGEQALDAGTVRLLPDADVGYLPQEAAAGEDTDLTIRQYVEKATGRLDGGSAI